MQQQGEEQKQNNNVVEVKPRHEFITEHATVESEMIVEPISVLEVVNKIEPMASWIVKVVNAPVGIEKD